MLPPFIQNSEVSSETNYFSQGITTGPAHTTFDPRSVTGPQRNVGFGYPDGVQSGGLVTYRIWPAMGGLTWNQPNVFRPTGVNATGVFTSPFAANSPANTVIPFFNNVSEGRAVQLVQNSKGQTWCIFDVPRTCGFYLSTFTRTNAQNIVVRYTGIDMYGQNLVSDAKLFMNANDVPADPNALPTTNTPIQAAFTPSAFAALTEPPRIISSNATSATTPLIQCFASNTFGLPYYLANPGHVSSFSYASSVTNPPNAPNPYAQYMEYNYMYPIQTDPDTYGVINAGPAGQTTMFSNRAIPFFIWVNRPTAAGALTLTNLGLVQGFPVENGVGDPPTPVYPSTTSATDVRGLFTPLLQYIPWLAEDNIKTVTYDFTGPITIQYYCEGSDIFQNIQKNQLNTFNNVLIPSSSDWTTFGYSNLGPFNPTCIPELKNAIGYIPYGGN